MIKKDLWDSHFIFSKESLPPAFSRFALFSVSQFPLSSTLAILCFIYSEIQIFTIFIKTAFINVIPNRLRWLKIFNYFHYISSVGDIISYDLSPLMVFCLLIIIFAYIYLVFGLAIYLFIVLKKQKTPRRLAQRIWRISCYLHSNVLFYPIHFSLVKISSELFVNETYLDPSRPISIVLEILIGTAVAINFIYCLVSLFCFQVFIKTSDPVSSKTNIPSLLNLIPKTIHPIIWFLISQKIHPLVLISANLCFSIVKDGINFYILPYYKLSTLRIATGLNSMSTLFAFTAFISAFVPLVLDIDEAVLPIILWLLFLPIFFKFYQRFLHNITMKILLTPYTIKNPYHLLHHWYIYKHFAKYSLKPTEMFKEHKENYLIYQSLLKTIDAERNSTKDPFKDPPTPSSIPHLNGKHMEPHHLIRSHVLDSGLEHLKEMIEQHPKNFLLKTNLAIQFIKTNRKYMTADRHIQEGLKASKTFSVRNSLYIIRLDIIKKLKDGLFDKYREDGKHIGGSIGFMSAQEYIKSDEMLSTLKEKIRAQLKFQQNFWSEFKSPKIQLHSLIKFSKKADKEANLAQACWWNYFETSKLKFPEPWLIYGLYMLVVLEEETLGELFIKKYHDLKLRDHHDHFLENAMQKKVLFKNPAWLAISGQPASLGKIFRCSDAVSEKLGVKKEALMGKSINALIPPLFRPQHDVYLQSESHSKNLTIFHKLREVQMVDKEGYLVPCLLYVMLSFIPGLELCYFALLQPIEEVKRVILFYENGNIASYSKTFLQDMNAFQEDDLNIYYFCPELRKAIKSLIDYSKNKSLGNISERRQRRPAIVAASLAHFGFKSFVQHMSEKTEQTSDNDLKAGNSEASNRLNENPSSNIVKLKFVPFCREDEMAISAGRFKNRSNRGEATMPVSARGKDLAEPVYYSAIIRIHPIKYGHFIHIIMEKLDGPPMGMDSVDLLGQSQPVFGKTYQTMATGFPPPLTRDSPREAMTPTNIGSSKKGIRFAKDEIFITIPKRGNDKISTLDTGLMEGSNSRRERGLVNKPSTEFGTIEKSPLNNPVNRFELNFNQDIMYNNTQSSFPLSPTREDRPLLTSENVLDSLPTYRVTFLEEKNNVVKFQRGNIKKLSPQIGDHPDFAEPQDNIMTCQDLDNKIPTSPDLIPIYGSSQQVASLDQEVVLDQREESPVIPNPGRKQIHIAARSVASNAATNRDERVKKAIKVVLQSRKLNKASYVYIISFALTMAASLGFMFWFSFHGQTLSDSLQNDISVLQTLQLRSFAINLVNQEMRMGAAMFTVSNNLTLYPKNLVAVVGPDGTIHNSMQLLQKYNKKLQSLVGLADSRIEVLFYEKNVRLWKRDENNNLLLHDTLNNIEVMGQIMSNGFLAASLSFPTAILPELPNGFRFVFDNTVDDLLEVGDKISEILFTYIEESYDLGKKQNVFIGIASLVVLILFLIKAIFFIRKINEEFFKFMNVLLTVPIADGERIGEKLASFDGLLAQEYDENQFLMVLNHIDPRAELKRRRLRRKDTVGTSNRINKANIRKPTASSINRIYRNNFIIFMELFVALLSVGVCLILFYLQSQNGIDILHQKQIFMNAALSNINQQSLLSVQLQGMILDNGTTTIKNLPAKVSLEQNILRLEEITQIQALLKDSTGHLSEPQVDIFYHYQCSDLATTLFDHLSPAALNRKCIEITNGKNETGIISLLPTMAHQLTRFIVEFENTNRTKDGIKNLYLKAISTFLSSIDVSVALFAISYDITAKSVESDLDQLHTDNLLMAIMAVIVSLFIALIIWYLIVRRMVNKHFDIKETLALIPTSLILENVHLKKYLLLISREDEIETKILGKN